MSNKRYPCTGCGTVLNEDFLIKQIEWVPLADTNTRVTQTSWYCCPCDRKRYPDASK